MYQLDYSPEQLSDWNEYFVKYRESHDNKWFNEFLHFYEPILEINARKYIKTYELEGYRLDDFKQIFSLVLWNELQEYNSYIPLLQIIKYKLLNEWHDYVRLNCGNFQPDNQHQYMLLRRIALLYYRKNDGKKPLTEIIAEIAEELDVTKESVANYITAVAKFKPKYNVDFYGDNEDDESFSAAVNSVSDGSSAETEFFQNTAERKITYSYRKAI